VSENKEKEANIIFETFLIPESPYEINTSQEILSNVRKNFELKEFKDDLFGELCQEIIWLLKDTFKRFLDSEELINYIQTQQMKEIKHERKSKSNIFGNILSPSSPKRPSTPKSSKRRNYQEMELKLDDGFNF
jgi:hypothetical protein